MSRIEENQYILLAKDMLRRPVTLDQMKATGGRLKEGATIADVYSKFHDMAQKTRIRRKGELEIVAEGLQEVVMFEVNNTTDTSPRTPGKIS